MESRPLNIQRRASGRAGWLAMLSGESQGRAVQRILPEMNAEGYKVAFIIEDNPSILWKVFNLVLAVCTLGFYWRASGVLIIGERVE